MDSMVDELLLLIMEIGIKRDILNYRDLASLAISAPRFRILSSIDSLWNLLLSKDFVSQASCPSSSSSAPANAKALYKQKFERIRFRIAAARKRIVSRVQSMGYALMLELKDLERQVSEETLAHSSALVELKNLERARGSAIALKAWQPNLVQLSHQKVLEQTPVPTESRIRQLKMEIAVCRERIVRFNKSIIHKKSLLEKANGDLISLTYKPIQECSCSCFTSLGGEETTGNAKKATRQRVAESLFSGSVDSYTIHGKKRRLE